MSASLRLLAITFVATVLSSCGHVHLGMHDVKREPIATSIILDKSVHVPPDKTVNLEFFPGEYRPVGQDSEGTYYGNHHVVRLHDIWSMTKDMYDKAGLYLRDDGTEGLQQWSRGGELVTHGAMVRPGQPQPAYRIIKNPVFKYVDPDAEDEEEEKR